MYMSYINKAKKILHYDLNLFKADILAGLIVALVALPLAMSFAIAIGVEPQYGIYAAMIGGILAALFGGSDVNVTGPTGAFIPILAAIVINFGYQNLLIAGFLAGLILLFAGIFKFGKLIEYIPYPVTLGFTAGIAAIIFTSQISNILGLQGVEKHEYFHQNILEIVNHISTFNLFSLFIAVLTMLVMIFLPKLLSKVPSALIAVIVSSVLVYSLHINIATILTVFGGIPKSLPQFIFPSFSFDIVYKLLPSAFTIAMLGAIESLLSCVVADSMTRKTHNSNAELMGQGIANIVTPFFGGIPVTGAIARTAVNVKSGAQTRFASIFHSIILLFIVLLFADLVNYIPLAALGGVLVVVSYRMSEIKHSLSVLKNADSTDAGALLITFFLTVFVNLTISISVGLIFACLIFIKKISDTAALPTIVDISDKERHLVAGNHNLKCPHLAIYTLEGPLFFGAARKIISSLKNISHSNALILRFRDVHIIDITAVNAIREIIEIHSQNKNIYMSGVNIDLLSYFKKTGLINMIGEDKIFKHTKDAINQALIDQNLHNGCEDYAITQN